MKFHTASAAAMIFSVSVAQAAECNDKYLNQIKSYEKRHDRLEEEYAGTKGKTWCAHVRNYSSISERYLRWLDSELQCEIQNRPAVKSMLERNTSVFQKILEQCSRARL